MATKLAQPARSTASKLMRTGKKDGDPRSLFIRVDPAPTNLGERRAVLRTLQRHGEVEMFKKLHDDRSFVSIASSIEMARKLVLRSPMYFEFITEKFDASDPLGGRRSEITSPVEPIETDKPPPASLRRELRQLSQKAFVLHIHPRADYRHKTVIRRSPLHGPWPDEEEDGGAAKESLMYNALKQVVPEGPDRDALCDWETGGQLSDEARVQRSLGSNVQVSHIQDRLARRERAEKVPSLAAILAAKVPTSVDFQGEAEDVDGPSLPDASDIDIITTDADTHLAGKAREDVSSSARSWASSPEWTSSDAPSEPSTADAAAARLPKVAVDFSKEASKTAKPAGSRWGSEWGSTFTKGSGR